MTKVNPMKLLAGVAFSAAVLLGSLSGAAQAASLKDSVDATLAYNPTIKAYQEYRQAAEHDLERARSGWYPRVDARAGYGLNQWSNETTRRNKRNGIAGQHSDDWYRRGEASLTISQTIWDGFATWSRVEMGESRLDSARSRLYDNAEGLALDSVLAHIEIYRQRRIVALSEINVKNHLDILRSQRERQRLGASTMADVTQTQSRLSRTQASLTESRAALEVAYANYKRLTNIDATDLEAPVAPVNPYPSLEVAQAHALTGNLKLAAMRSDINTSESQVELDKAAFWPQLYLEAGPSYSYGVQGTNTDNWGTTVMLRANWNIFNGGYDWYNVKGDKARSRQARQEMMALIDSLTNETTSSWSYLVAAQEQSKYYANSVQYATSTRDMYLEQFNVGQRSLLDVLDSENELYSSSIQLVTAQLNVIASQYRLLTLAGELLSNFNIDRSQLVVQTDNIRMSPPKYTPPPLP